MVDTRMVDPIIDKLIKHGKPYGDTGLMYIRQSELTNTEFAKLLMLPEYNRIAIHELNPVYLFKPINEPQSQIVDMYLTANINRAKKYQAWEGRT